jgi:hypothetical protein
MTQPVMLHPQEHKDLRILTQRGAKFGDDVQFCLTFPLEFREVQAHYPIVFRKTIDEAGWEALALFGLEAGENLFLGAGGNGWFASYVPLAMVRQPFLIAVDGQRTQIQVDMDHPRVSRTEGEALFLKYGGTTEYMEEVDLILSAIYDGVQGQGAFFAELAQLGLLVPFSAELDVAGRKQRLEGFHAIDEDKLAALPADALERLNRAGHLEAIYMAVASLSHLRALAVRKEQRDAAHA